MKKSTIISLVIAFSFIMPSVSQAVTIEELQVQINALMAQLAAMSGQQGEGFNPDGCYTFNTNLTVGSRGADVTALQEMLITQGYLIMPEEGKATGYFGILTKAAVAKWQVDNGIYPANGFVGPISRARMNQLYGCGVKFLPSIQVLSPNGGETWAKGTTQTIGWQDNSPMPLYQCVGDLPCPTPQRLYDLKLLRSQPTCIGTMTSCPPFVNLTPYTIAYGVPGSSYNWTLGQLAETYPNVIPDGSYMVQVCQSTTTTCDSSDNYFSIVSNSTLTVTVPNGGEKWQIGSLHTVQWNPYNPQLGINVVPNVSAYLERIENGNFISLGKIIESGKASIHWTGELDSYGNYAQAGDYYVRVVNSQTGQSDRSDRPFTLVPQNTVKADLRINDSDEPVALPARGATVTLSWNSENSDGCRIYMNGLADDLLNLPSSGQRSVFLKQNPYTGQLAISLWCESSIGSTNDTVWILPYVSQGTSITITSPNGGENLPILSPYSINWVYSTDIDRISIALYKNDAFFKWIVTDLPWSGPGLLSWNPSITVTSGDIGGQVFKIYIIGYKSGGGTIEDKSDAPFSIVSSTAQDTTLKVKRANPDTSFFTAQPTSAWVDSGTAPDTNNLSTFMVNAGQHTVYANQVPDYTIAGADLCFGAGCSTSAAYSNGVWPLTPSCDQTRCSITLDVAQGKEAKVVFEYVPNTNLLRVKRVGADLKTVITDQTSASIDNLASTSTNPSDFMVSAGPHTAYVTKVPGYEVYAGVCYNADGCVPSYLTSPFCGDTSCRFPVTVSSDFTKVVFEYLPQGVGVSNNSNSNLASVLISLINALKQMQILQSN